MKKVLLTSASKPLLRRNISLLENKGFHFLTTSSGSGALKLHEGSNFDLILCDAELEDMDCGDFCFALRKLNEREVVPVVIICHNTADCIAKAKQSGASAIVMRPVDPTHLLITIGSFIDMQLARSKRVVFDAPVSTMVGQLKSDCNAKDISVSGILIETEDHFELSNKIAVKFTITDGGLINASGEVVRCFRSSKGKLRYGVKFLDLDLPDRKAIERYVATNNHLGIKPKLDHQLQKSRSLEVSRV